MSMDSFWTAGIVVLAIMNALTLVALLAFARELGTVLVRLGPSVPRVVASGPQTGTTIEPLELRSLDGAVHRVMAGKSRWKLLMFVAPACPSCLEIAPALRTFAAQYSDRVQVFAVSSGDPVPGDFEYAASLGAHVAFTRDARLATELHIPGTPYAVLLDASNVVVSLGVTNNLEQLESLIAVQVRQLGRPPASDLALVEVHGD